MQNLIFAGSPCLSKTGGNHVWRATPTAERKTEFTPKVREVPAAQMTHSHVLQLLPNPLSGSQVGRVGRELLRRNLVRSTVGRVWAHLPCVPGRAIPNPHHFVRDVRQQVVEKDHTSKAVQRLIAPHRGASAVRRDPAQHGHLIARVWPAQDRCLSAGGIRADVPRQERKPRLVREHARPAFDMRLFLSRGQPWKRHCSITASSRWAARSIGSCGVQGKRFNNRETWASWYQTPNASPLTVATRAQVQHSPRKPYAPAPWEKSSGIKRPWSPVRVIGPVGLGLARHAAMPCSRPCASQWLTAAGETPSASAISPCVHPCGLSSNARWRRASCQVWGNPCRRPMGGC
jgi:hypothetical protein